MSDVEIALSSVVVADAIASCALEHYKTLPQHGKPRLGQEWTIYAALVVVVVDDVTIGRGGEEKPYVLSSATGSKCTTTGPEGWCLRDLHAEVLVKRGLQRILWNEVRSKKLNLLRRSSEEGWYEMRPDVELHLYVSDAPCGDATIYELSNGDVNFTGAKLIATGSLADNDSSLRCHNQATVTREQVQELGKLRVKSGRSNLPDHLRSTSLACSDKILQWTLLGMQGTLLPVHPILLRSIVVSRDPHAKSKEAQEHALERAIIHRRNQVLKDLADDAGFVQTHGAFLQRVISHQLKISVVDEVFECAKSQLVVPFQAATSTNTDTNQNGKRTIEQQGDIQPLKPRKVSPCGVCFNWQKGDKAVEVLVGNRGHKQGKKPQTDADYAKQASRLCRRAMHLNHTPEQQKSYRGWKESVSSSCEKKRVVHETHLLKGWIKSNVDFNL